MWEYEEIDWVGTLSASCLLEGWVEEERLSVKDPAEYARIWAHGGHLAGMLTLDQVIEWRVSTSSDSVGDELIGSAKKIGPP